MCSNLCVTLPPCLLLLHVDTTHIPFLGRIMYKQKLSMYSSEDVIEEFYDAIADGDSKRLRRVHIPKSDVFYVREALEARLGKRYTLDHVERAMYLEGFLEKHEVLDPERKRKGVG